MDNIEKEKLTKFKIDCLKQASREAADLQLQIKEQVDKLVSEEIDPYNHRQELKFKRKMTNLENEFHTNCYVVDSEAKQTLIRKQKEIKNDFKTKLQRKTQDFVETPDYEEYLFNNINRTLNKMGEDKLNTEDICIYLTLADRERFENKVMEKYKNVKIETIDESYLGGCKCLNSKLNIFIDNTLKLSIEEQVEDRRW